MNPQRVATRRRGRALNVALAVALAAGVTGCSGGGADDDQHDGDRAASTVVIDGAETPVVPATVPEPRVADLDAPLRGRIDAAVANGGAFAEARLDQADPALLAFYDYVWRNWEVAGLATARATAEAMPRPTAPEPAQFLRLIHPDSPMPELGLDGFENPMLLALYCDQSPLPPEFADTVADLVRSGSPPDLAIATFAIVWAGELGCSAPDLTELAASTVERLAAHLPARTVIVHESVQVSVGLTYLGRADLVPLDWVSALIDAQGDDGGWSEVPEGEPSLLTTAMALWTLAGVKELGAGVPMVLID